MKKILGFLVLVLVFVLGLLWINSVSVLRIFNSPDNRYRLQVLRYQYQSFFARAPGQGGGSAGILRLLDRSGHVLQETEIEMVSVIDQVEWEKNSVYIKFVGNLALP